MSELRELATLLKTKISPFDQARLARETAPQVRSLWGQPENITPALVDEIFGDGEQLIGLEPIMTRPNYYVIRVDSAWDLDNTAKGEVLADHLDDIYNAIEEQYGDGDSCDDCDDGEDEDPKHSCDGRPFPALTSGGSSWFPL